MTYIDRYPNLHTFLNYFEWVPETEELHSFKEITKYYLNRVHTSTLQATLDELDRFIIEISDFSEDEASEIIIKMGLNIDLGQKGGWNTTKSTYKEQLIDIKDILKNELNTRKSEF